MHSVLNAILKSGDASRPKSVRHWFFELPNISSLHHAMAAHQLNTVYERLGRYGSKLGMPVDASYRAHDVPTIFSTGSGYAARFRSGDLILTNAVRENALVTNLYEAQLLLVALECIDKQEVCDEITGSVGCIRGSDHVGSVVNIPKVTLGGKKQRVVTLGDIVYQGAFANLNLVCSLVEKDSGDTTKYREAFAKVIADAAKAGGAAAGVPSEATTGGERWMHDLSRGLSDVLLGKLGADDALFNSQTLLITADEMTQFRDGHLTPKTLKRDDDPREVQYTHRLSVNGEDDGGDTGEYAFYFLLRSRPLPDEFR